MAYQQLTQDQRYQISASLKAGFSQYHSWERGLNENTNGLVRQYVPKGSDFTAITAQQVPAVAERLNERPRKRLGFQTPNHVFFKSATVALRC